MGVRNESFRIFPIDRRISLWICLQFVLVTFCSGDGMSHMITIILRVWCGSNSYPPSITLPCYLHWLVTITTFIKYVVEAFVIGSAWQVTRIGRDAVLYVESLIESIMGGLEGLINILDSEGGFGALEIQVLLHCCNIQHTKHHSHLTIQISLYLLFF